MKNSITFKLARLSRLVALLAMGAFTGLVSSTGSFAQGQMKGKGSGGWEMDTQYGRMYNLNTLDTIAGEVISVERITPQKGMSYGVHLMVKTNKEVISVHLGPEWYIENQNITIKTGDKIEVNGSRITFEGKPAIIAAEIKIEDEVIQLRNEYGQPIWSGRRWK